MYCRRNVRITFVLLTGFIVIVLQTNHTALEWIYNKYKNADIVAIDLLEEDRYRFIYPPYKGLTPMSITVVKDVCVEEDRKKKGRSVITIYNSSANVSETIQTFGSVNPWNIKGVVDWQVVCVTGQAPAGHRMVTTPAYFWTQLWPGNIHHFIEDGIRGNFYSSPQQKNKMLPQSYQILFRKHLSEQQYLTLELLLLLIQA